jgi:hypothetical protein
MPRAVVFAAPPRRNGRNHIGPTTGSRPSISPSPSSSSSILPGRAHKRTKLSDLLVVAAASAAAVAAAGPATVVPEPSGVSRVATPKTTSSTPKLRFPATSSCFDSAAPSLKPSLNVLVSRCLPPPESSASSSSSSTPTHPHPHSLTADVANSRSSNPSPQELRLREQAAERVRVEKAAKRAAAAAAPKGKGMKRSSSAASTGLNAKRANPATPLSPTMPANTHLTRSRASSPVASEPAVLGARTGLKRTRSTGLAIPTVVAAASTPASPIAHSPLRRAATLSPPAAETHEHAPVPSTFPLRHAKPVEMRRLSSSGTDRVRRETTLPRNLREYETRVGAMS